MLTAVMMRRFVASGSFMPAGLVAILNAVLAMHSLLHSIGLFVY